MEQPRFFKLTYGTANKIIRCPCTYNEYILGISSCFSVSKNLAEALFTSYQDPEGDSIAISNQEDYEATLKLMKEKNIKLLKVCIKKGENICDVGTSKDFEILKSMIKTRAPPQNTKPKNGEVHTQTDCEKKPNMNQFIQTEHEPKTEETQKDFKGRKFPCRKRFPINFFKEGTIEYEKNKAKIDITWAVLRKFSPMIKEMINELYSNAEKEIERKFSEKEKGNKIESDIHFGAICEGCNATPIKGIRYKCSVCPNFDFCEKCEEKLGLDHGHAFIKLHNTDCIKMLKNNGKGCFKRKENGCCEHKNDFFKPQEKKEIPKEKEKEKVCTADFYKTLMNLRKSINFLNPHNEKKHEFLSIQKNDSLAFETRNNNTEFTANLKVMNNGHCDWPSPCYLKCHEGSDFNGETIKINRPVKAGETVDLGVKMNLRNIPKQGKYFSKWQLQDGKRKFFGQVFNFELNCLFDSNLKIKPCCMGGGYKIIEPISTNELLRNYAKRFEMAKEKCKKDKTANH